VLQVVHLVSIRFLLKQVSERGTDGGREFFEVPAPSDNALQGVLHKIITRRMRLPISGPVPSTGLPAPIS